MERDTSHSLPFLLLCHICLCNCTIQERENLAGQLEGITQELTSMRAAWVERDERQRLQDLKIKELLERVGREQQMTRVATQKLEEAKKELVGGCWPLGHEAVERGIRLMQGCCEAAVAREALH